MNDKLYSLKLYNKFPHHEKEYSDVYMELCTILKLSDHEHIVRTYEIYELMTGKDQQVFYQVVVK